MTAAWHMLSGKLYVITRPLSSVVHSPYRSSARWVSSGLQFYDPRGSAAAGLQRPTASSKSLCRARHDTDGAALESKVLEDDATKEEDFSQFQHNDYGRSRVKEAVASNETKNYLQLTDKELLSQCKMGTYRASGPGGQHRNKTDSAVRLKHVPTGLVTQACEDRSQHNNRTLALGRMRQLIALEVREKVELEGYKPPPELVRILPYEKGAKKDRSVQKIGPNHPDFAQGVKSLLDLIEAVRGSVSDAAPALGLTTGSEAFAIVSSELLASTFQAPETIS